MPAFVVTSHGDCAPCVENLSLRRIERRLHRDPILTDPVENASLRFPPNFKVSLE